MRVAGQTTSPMTQIDQTKRVKRSWTTNEFWTIRRVWDAATWSYFSIFHFDVEGKRHNIDTTAATFLNPSSVHSNCNNMFFSIFLSFSLENCRLFWIWRGNDVLFFELPHVRHADEQLMDQRRDIREKQEFCFPYGITTTTTTTKRENKAMCQQILYQTWRTIIDK